MNRRYRWALVFFAVFCLSVVLGWVSLPQREEIKPFSNGLKTIGLYTQKPRAATLRVVQPSSGSGLKIAFAVAGRRGDREGITLVVDTDPAVQLNFPARGEQSALTTETYQVVGVKHQRVGEQLPLAVVDPLTRRQETFMTNRYHITYDVVLGRDVAAGALVPQIDSNLIWDGPGIATAGSLYLVANLPYVQAQPGVQFSTATDVPHPVTQMETTFTVETSGTFTGLVGNVDNITPRSWTWEGPASDFHGEVSAVGANPASQEQRSSHTFIAGILFGSATASLVALLQTLQK